MATNLGVTTQKQEVGASITLPHLPIGEVSPATCTMASEKDASPGQEKIRVTLISNIYSNQENKSLSKKTKSEP
jgi:hypothetical protein